MTTKAMLATLNECRVKLGMNPLKAWKESRAKLELALQQAQRVAGDQPSTSQETKPVEEKPEAPKPEVSAAKKPEVKMAKKELPKKVNGVSLVEIARELKVDDKVARAKLRRLGDKVPAGTGGDNRWVFSPKDAETVKSLLTEDRRLK